MTSAKALLQPRKQPRQARARATVQAILDATAQVLVSDGLDRASTNRIAHVAGVSIGSLYQYYPNKQALIAAVVDRYAEEEVALLGESIVSLADLPIRSLVPAFLTRMLDAHERDPALLRVILQQAMHLGIERMVGLEAQAHALLAGWIQSRADEVDVPDPEATAQVLSTAVTSIAHARVLGTVTLDRPTLERELTQMTLRILGVT
jgi:AcrR family transcriptional regulator